MKRKRILALSILLIMAMAMGNIAYAAPDLGTEQTEIVEPRRYAILDTLTYGLSFNGTQVNCYASAFAAHAEKFVVSGMVQKKTSQGYYDYVCTWPEETIYGQSCNWDKYCTAAGDGEYLFTFYIDIYDGSKWENLTFTKAKTR